MPDPQSPTPGEVPPSPPQTIRLPSSDRPTAECDRLSLPHKVIYGLGGACFQFGGNTVNNLAQPIYNITLGVNPALIGLVQVLTRVWDALSDPLIGTWSDNCRHPRGRRKPFIVGGAILTGLLFPLLWFVPRSFDENAAFLYFLITSLVFFTAFTAYAVPYQTLGYELTPDYDERTRLMAIRTLVNQGALLAMPWLFRLTQMDIFADAISGIRVVSIGMGALVMLLGLLPGLFLIERYHKLAVRQEKRSVREAFFIPFRNRPFLIVVAIVLLMGIGTQTVEALGIYINIYYVCDGNIKLGATMTGLFGTTSAFASIVASYVFNRIAGRYDKLFMLRICLLSAMAASIAKWFLYTPEQPYLQLIVAVLISPGVAGFWIYTNSLKADICDWDEWESGQRREGIYGAASSWIHKTGTSVTYVLTAGVLLAAGFQQELGGAQGDDTLHFMRAAFTLVPLVFLIVAYGLTFAYPITDAKAARIRAELEARRDRV